MSSALAVALGYHAPGAECVAVKDGKIVRSRFVFDREPFLAAAR